MEYTKTTWADGDTITAKKLNNIENGIEELAKGGGGSQSGGWPMKIDLTEIKPEEISGVTFYPYIGGLTIGDLIGAWIIKIADDNQVQADVITYADASSPSPIIDLYINHQTPRTSEIHSLGYDPTTNNPAGRSGFLYSQNEQS